MRTIPFALVDAFTEEPFAGNAAGVVTAAGLGTEQMQRIARELGQTETCFVSASDAPGTDFALRWFTPTVEVDLCGHATVASFVTLAADGRIRWRDDRAHVHCATRVGPIGVWLERTPSGATTVMMSAGRAALEAASEDRAAVAQATGIAPAALDTSLPLRADHGSQRLIVPVAHLADLLHVIPNGAGMVEYGKRSGYRRFTAICRETKDPAHFVHLRHFAPANGIPEDPVTGTAHAVAAIYLDEQGLLPRGDRVVLTGEQGHAVGRRGVVIVEVVRRVGQIVDVRIGGRAVIVGRGDISAPP
jgi:trans-2,3-dihydro-3-hydroxyanthranilate isomerase